MAMFFQNNHIKCHKCGGDVMSLQSLYFFEEGDTNKELICEPFSKRIVCANCGATVRTIDNFTTVKNKK